MAPTDQREKNKEKISSTTDFPPPPLLPNDILTRPPLVETPISSTLQTGDILPFSGEHSPDILLELEEGGFGSILKSVPPKNKVNFQAETLVIEQFCSAADAYIKAADKHLELNFFENAAINYSCAVLCVLLSEDVFQAAHLMNKLGKKVPPVIHSSNIFQGVKMLLKANLLQNAEFLVKAEERLLSNFEHLYKEDQILIQRAMKYTEKLFEDK